MQTVLVASSKGGAGNTTPATHLAAQFALAGKRIVLVDADPQGSSTRWCQRRAGFDSAVLPIDGTRRGWEKAIPGDRSEEQTPELQSLMRISYAVLRLKKK